MIQDSINQLLTLSAAGAGIAQKQLTESANIKFNNAQEDLLGKQQEALAKHNKSLLEYKNNGFGRAPSIDVHMSEAEQGAEVANLKNEANKAAKRPFFPDKNAPARAAALERNMQEQFDRANLETRSTELAKSKELQAKKMAEQSRNSKIESKITQTEEFKKLKELLETRHSKGAKQREAIQYMNDLEKGGK